MFVVGPGRTLTVLSVAGMFLVIGPGRCVMAMVRWVRSIRVMTWALGIGWRSELCSSQTFTPRKRLLCWQTGDVSRETVRVGLSQITVLGVFALHG